MAAGRVNIVFERGATFDASLLYRRAGVPQSLAGYSAKMEVRPALGSATVLLTASTADGSILLEPNGDMGRITFKVPPSSTSLLIADAPAVFDLKLSHLTDANVRKILIRGDATTNETTTA